MARVRQPPWRLRLCVAVLAGACAEPAAPAPGLLAVHALTYGLDRDPDGYEVRIGARQTHIATEGTVHLHDQAAGLQQIYLEDLAANCAVRDGSPQLVDVRPEVRTDFTFFVDCAAITGWVLIWTHTSGASLDGDGYLVTLDGKTLLPVPTNGTLWIYGLAPGPVALTVSDIGANCVLQGPNPISAAITAGAMTRFDLTILCT